MNLFRRIRFQSLNSVYKYLLYALGEIVLVVAGILIALQFNDWNEAKRERVQEQQIFVQLIKEYESNLSQLREKIQLRNTIIASAFRILKAVDNPTAAEGDTVIVRLSWLVRDPTFDPIKNDIIGTSNMRVILNDSLRMLLTNWESDVFQLQEVELQWQKIRTEMMIPYTIERGLARGMHDGIWKNGYTPVGSLDKSAYKALAIGKPKDPLDFKKVLRDPALSGLAATAITMNQICNMQAVALENRIRMITDLLDREIDKEPR